MSEPKPQPTFRYCPDCGSMVVTNRVSYWCENDDCDWGLMQTALRFPDPDPNPNAE